MYKKTSYFIGGNIQKNKLFHRRRYTRKQVISLEEIYKKASFMINIYINTK